ncbi:Uncharacterized protein DBV15_01700 [Temnothorax longispinosus]|uniref:Uncharacterized protein n=1 Tax=Temnothorax longispinosus TaxID=300112 RepID=A0A4S2L109_9HYME|nr:Uncharacterized protein DBV15_01700 [Temnothorax longispinosus]
MGQSVADITARDRPDEEIGKHSSVPTRRTNMRSYERTGNKAAVKGDEREEGPDEKANDVRKPGKEIEKVPEISLSLSCRRKVGRCAEDKNLHKPPIKSRVVY